MKSLRIFFPHALIVWWTTANFLLANRDEYYGISTAVLFFLSVFLVLVALTSAALRIMPRHRSAVLIFSYLGIFSMFLTPLAREILDPFMRYRYILLLMLALTAGLSWLVIKITAEKDFVWVMSFMFLVLAAMPTVQLAYFKAERILEENSSRVSQVPLKGPAVMRPNVYFILLDAYMRGDILKRNLGYDNSAFLAFMKERGFIENDQSYSSYPWTIFSIMSTLQMEYETKYDTSVWSKRLISNTYKNFQSLGYDLYFMAQSRGIVPCPESVQCLSGDPKSDRFFFGRLGTTLIKTIPLLEDFLLKFAPERFYYELNEISDLEEVIKTFEPKNPSFIYAHILMPHSPYTRDKDCEKVNFHAAGDFKSFRWETRGKYLDFLTCGNRQFMPAIDSLIAKDPDAIVIVQGDHGAYFTYQKHTKDDGLPQPGKEKWRKGAMEEAYAILNLMRLPKACQDLPYPAIGPVNTFRLVFACLTQTDPDYIPDQSYTTDGKQRKIELIRQNGKWLF